jgi:hypothetical protein
MRRVRMRITNYRIILLRHTLEVNKGHIRVDFIQIPSLELDKLQILIRNRILYRSSDSGESHSLVETKGAPSLVTCYINYAHALC